MLARLVAFDVDGTLISLRGECSPRIPESIERLRDAGVVVAVATGRPLGAMAETIEAIGEVDFTVSGNGGVLRDEATGALLRSTVMPGALVASAVTAMRDVLPGVGVAVDVGEAVIAEDGFIRRLPPHHETEPVADALIALGSPTPDVQRLALFHDDFDDDLPALAAIVNRHLDEGCSIFYGTTLALVEVVPAGNDKAVALAQLAAHLGIDPSDATVFGDGLNDLAMFAWAGTAVAMGDSCPALIELADHVTGTVAQDGVADFVDSMLATT